MDTLKQQVDIFATFFRTSPDYCSISTLDGGVMVDVNDSFVRITGWSRQEVIGKSVFEFGLWRHPETRSEMVERIRNEGHILIDSIVLRTRTGGLVECSATMFGVDYQGQECLISIIRDVSVRRRAEAALERLARGAGHNTRSLFENLVDDLAQTIGVERCLIGTVSPENPGLLLPIAAHIEGGLSGCFNYRYDNGPATKLLEESLILVPEHAWQLFPQDSCLAENRLESFAGVSLRDRQGKVMGMLLIMGLTPLSNPEIVGTLLQVFADRAASEMVIERERLAFIGVQTRLMAELEETRDNFERQAGELQSMLDASPLTMGVAVDRKWVKLNRAYEKMFGYTIEESLGVSLDILYLSHDDFIDYGEKINTALTGGGVSHIELQYRRKNGEIFWANNYGRLIDPAAPEKGAVVILEDISERKAAEARIRHMAEHDQLTGLPNRAMLRDRFEQEVRRAHRDNRKLALLFLDLDRFKQVNDTYGHAVGDELLKAVVERVLGSIREIDTVCRQGGDEFVVLLPDLGGTRDVSQVAKRIVEAMAKPFHLAGHQLSISFSIGVAFYPNDALGFEYLLQCADLAMYQAKQSGRNNCQFYQASMRA
ncbi:MAG: hypothetical protein H6R18_702 [Proteobacteria bacterium]|nr:hypothetical protein [Pseudomonadota bacterium]